jgi:hypothetical protein
VVDTGEAHPPGKGANYTDVIYVMGDANRRAEDTKASSSPARLQPLRPSAYLDQWLWIRLASASLGKPREPSDVELLDALVAAADSGVAFPLSPTHYIETLRVRDPAQRAALAEVMGAVSHCRTLRSRRGLLRDQLLLVMHERFGRPAFRPERGGPFGVGVHWAFTGKVSLLRVYSSETGEPVRSATVTDEILCRWNQWSQIQFLAGPRDDDVDRMRERYGYMPELTEEAGMSRLAWEADFAGLLQGDPVTAKEVRLRVQVREVVHELIELLVETFAVYALPIRVLMGGERSTEGRREFVVSFFDSMPSVRVAVDLKAAVYRNNTRGWSLNDLYDTDAMSLAVPYCDVVVADKATVDALVRAKTGERTGTLVTSRPDELLEVLPDLVARARLLADPSGWDRVAPGVGWAPMSPEEFAAAHGCPGPPSPDGGRPAARRAPPHSRTAPTFDS